MRVARYSSMSVSSGLVGSTRCDYLAKGAGGDDFGDVLAGAVVEVIIGGAGTAPRRVLPVGQPSRVV